MAILQTTEYGVLYSRLQCTRYKRPTPHQKPVQKKRKEEKKSVKTRRLGADSRVVGSSQNGNAHVRREAPILVVTLTYLPPRLLFFFSPPPTPRLLSHSITTKSSLLTPIYAVPLGFITQFLTLYLSLSSRSIHYWVGSDITGPVGFRTPQSSPVNLTFELPTTLSLLQLQHIHHNACLRRSLQRRPDSPDPLRRQAVRP